MMSTVSEKLLQVAENVPKVYHAGQLNIIENAECLKGSKSGSAILIDDISPVTHDMGVKVRGKNLFNKSTLRIDIGTKNLTQINNGFTFQTNATKATMSVACDIFLGVGTYYCSGTVSSSDGLNGGWGVYDPIKGVYIINASNRGTVNDRFTITESKTYKLSFFANYNSVTDVTMTFTNIQLELGTTATAYTPYVSDLTAVKVKKYGKNLLDPSLYLNTATFQGITYTTNGDIVTLTGTAKASSYVNIFSSNPDAVIPLPSILKNKKIKLYAYGNSYTVELLIRKTTGANTVSANNNQSIDTTGATGFSIRCRFASGNTYNDSIKFMITEEGVENNTEYEPYIAPTEYTPNADGTVEGVTSLYPNTTLMTDTDGVLIDCEYLTKSYTDILGSTNLKNGSAIGSLRTVGSAVENSEYKIGQYAFAEGNNTKALGYASHAEGSGVTASHYSH